MFERIEEVDHRKASALGIEMEVVHAGEVGQMPEKQLGSVAKEP